MGSSRRTATNLLGFLTDASTRGTREALRSLNLEALAGRSIEEVFVGMSDHVCPDGGSVDEGIARGAFVETIADLAANGISDLDTLNRGQVETVLELYISHAIEGRICNDIAASMVTLPPRPCDAERVQRQTLELIRRAVADALTTVRGTVTNPPSERVADIISSVYDQAFEVLRALGQMEAEAP